ncbi:MAG: hypothetical protein PHP55_01835 [Methanoculleus sp.]|uniref:hypothetical protein n=1 Tax=Methanoculleus sp. TaxID=90427 RepID=UPI0025F948B2|nr:hypothetical protein [Methanoculleus sp.]MCK9319050.1 hypothetical protein [Methanoculleus sp.]MDD3932576.1 hypothetical protein [Methanoculleus sp.]
MKKEKATLLFVLCISMLLIALIIGNFVQIQKLKNESQEQQAQINELQPTQKERYLYSVLEEEMSDNVQFIELDATMTDTIEGRDNVMYVIELTEITMVEITIRFKNNFLEWYDNSVDLNIYYGGISEPDIIHGEDLEKTASYTFALQKGFYTIELDSYSSYTWEYTIDIREKN